MCRSGVSLRATPSSQPLTGIRPGKTRNSRDNDSKSTLTRYKLNLSQLLSGKGSNRSQPKSGNDTTRLVLKIGHFCGPDNSFTQLVLNNEQLRVRNHPPRSNKVVMPDQLPPSCPTSAPTVMPDLIGHLSKKTIIGCISVLF